MTIQITITNAGFDALINASATGTNAVAIAAYGVSEAAVSATPDLLALPNELKRIGSVSGGVVSRDTIHVVLQDMGEDAYSLRSFGLYLSDGTLFGIYGQADPILIKTASSDALLATDIQFADIDATSITFGATNFFNPPATETVQGVAEIATQAEANAGVDDQRIVTPKKAKASLLSWLGYTPIQQGGGAGQQANKMYIGWSGSRLKLQVDNADIGFITTDNNLGFGSISLNGYTMRRGGIDLWGPDNDGAGSGLDADLLDGADGSKYARKDQAATFTSTLACEAQLRVSSSGIGATAFWAMQPDGMLVLYAGYSNPIAIAGYNVNASGAFGFTVQLTVNGNKVWHAGNDGAGSGLDADLLDGQDSGYYTDIKARLGYTPVRQGGGTGQGSNTIYIGWDGSRLRAQVDATDQGPIWTAATDGSGSGLDADLLDGQDGSYYTNITGRLGYTPANRAGDTFTGDVSVAHAGDVSFSVISSGVVTGSLVAQGDGNIVMYRNSGAGRVPIWASDGAYLNAGLPIMRQGQKVWDAGNDGAGSGLDADLLDGQDSSYYTDIKTRLGYTPANRAGDTFSGPVKFLSDIQFGPANAHFYSNTIGVGLYDDARGRVVWYQDGPNNAFRVETSDLMRQGNRVWDAGNDGTGSGLDADLLDGQDSSYYTNIAGRLGFTPANRAGDTFQGEVSALRLRARSNGDGQAVSIGDDVWIGDANITSTVVVRGQANGAEGYIAFGSITTGLGCYANDATLRYGGNPVWHAGNDGSGSGLDADLLDGRDASSFASAGDFGFGSNENGYWEKRPNGVIEQWGTAPGRTSEGAVVINFPIAFTDQASVRVFPVGVNVNSNNRYDVIVQRVVISTNGATVYCQWSANDNSSAILDGVDWRAIGR